MSPLTINLISALAISLVITAMVAVKSQRAKSVIVVLPIPITIALLGSGGQASSLSLIGLALTAGFYLAVFGMYNKRVNIVFADVLAAIMYVVLAFLITKSIHAPFPVVAGLFFAVWALTMLQIHRSPLARVTQTTRLAPLPLRSVVIFLIAFLLFTFKQYLAAFVVTFPYNSVFAVYENRQNLLVQTALFVRNSIALWAYFVANYFLTRSGAHWYAYVASWTAFGLMIILVSKTLPLAITEEAD